MHDMLTLLERSYVGAEPNSNDLRLRQFVLCLTMVYTCNDSTVLPEEDTRFVCN
jgi:hypothetical protein